MNNLNQNPNPKIIEGNVSYIPPLKNQCIQKISNQEISNQEIDPNTKMKMKINSLNECITKMKLNNNNVPKFKNETIEPSLQIKGTDIIISFDFSEIFKKLKNEQWKTTSTKILSTIGLMRIDNIIKTIKDKILNKFTTSQNINVETGTNREKNKEITPKKNVLSMTNIEWIEDKLTMTIDIKEFFKKTVVQQKILPKLKLSKASLKNGFNSKGLNKYSELVFKNL